MTGETVARITRDDALNSPNRNRELNSSFVSRNRWPAAVHVADCAGVERRVNRAHPTTTTRTTHTSPSLSAPRTSACVAREVTWPARRGETRRRNKATPTHGIPPARQLLVPMCPWYTSDQDVCANRVPRRPLRVRYVRNVSLLRAPAFLRRACPLLFTFDRHNADHLVPHGTVNGPFKRRLPFRIATKTRGENNI